MTKHWNRLPRVVEEFLSLGILQPYLDTFLYNIP